MKIKCDYCKKNAKFVATFRCGARLYVCSEHKNNIKAKTTGKNWQVSVKETK